MHWLKHIFRHRHDWEDMGRNKWLRIIEQRCRKCGEYRHHLFEDVSGDEINWRFGTHPNAVTQ